MGRLCVFLTLVAVLVAVARESTAAGAGRAFPVESENYVTERFHTINSRLEWDETNFLVDLSGLYANCGWLGRTGPTDVDRLTPDGVTITGVVDSTPGARADIDAVNDYIRTVVDRWVSEGRYNGQIRTAQRFGCSVRPGCSGNAVIGCLFSPGGFNDQNDEEPNDRPDDIVEGDQRGLAFTPEQYLVAERFTGTTWDRSHLLENLSGFETSCSMLAVPEGEWPFTRIRAMEQELGYSISHEYGYSPNLGSTDEALVNIISKFHKIKSAQFIGCSIIPDCIAADRIMYAVISCLYHN